MKIVRDRYTKSSYKSIHAINKVKNGEIDILYENLIKERALKADIFPIMVFQPATHLNNNVKLGQKLLGLIRSKLLLSTIHLLNEKELLVINRGEPIKYGKKPMNSYSYIYVPIEKINSIEFEKCKEYNGIQRIFISTKANRFMFYFDERNEELIEFYVKLSEINSK